MAKSQRMVVMDKLSYGVPTHAHLCPPMNNNIAPMPTQKPWAWVGMGMGTQRRALVHIPNKLMYAPFPT